jgi:hypothetical protein
MKALIAGYISRHWPWLGGVSIAEAFIIQVPATQQDGAFPLRLLFNLSSPINFVDCFLGDDIWLTVFSIPLHPEIYHDFHSLEADDLHTFNKAVTASLFLSNLTHAHSRVFPISPFHGGALVQTTR